MRRSALGLAACGAWLAAGCGDGGGAKTDASDTGEATDATTAGDATDATASDATDATTSDATDATGGDATVTTDVGPDATATDAADGDATGPGALTFAAWCDAAAAARWDFYGRCFGTDIYRADSPEVADQAATCKAAEREITDGRLAFDGVRAAACVAAVNANACVGGFDPLGTTAACEGVVSGRVGNGEPCHPYAGLVTLAPATECVDGQCRDADGACPATCQPWAAIGEACGPDGLASIGCAPGAYCSAAGECAAVAGDGDACADRPCAAGLACLPGGPGSTCKDVATGDEACSAEVPCSPPVFQCVAGECRFRVGRGDPCTLPDACPDDLRCRVTATDPTPLETCTDPAGLGDPCTGSECADGLWCDTGAGDGGACKALGGSGVACASSAQCQAGLWCAWHGSGPSACEAAGEAGGSCRFGAAPSADPRACESGLHCMADGVCHPAGALGAPCDPLQSDATCAAGLWCDVAAGTCKAPAAAAAACSPFAAGSCADGRACRCTASGVACATVVAGEAPPFECGDELQVGETCWADGECVTARCDRCRGGMCVGAESPGRCAEEPTVCISAADDTGPRSGLIADPVVLVRATWSFGECQGNCKGELTFDGATVTYTIKDIDNTPKHEAHGMLTTTAAGRLDELIGGLVGENLQVTYGCPGCADGGVDTLDFTFAGEPFTTHYEQGSAPSALLALDGLLRRVMTNLGACTSSEDVLVQGACPFEL